jgi:DNA-binding CsgD family transcriptional regulator/tetratricopeptide (TPR) repeat protein
MELWERGPALGRLDQLLAASADGGRVALVAGEAGLGKSALVSEFAQSCDGRSRVLWGSCDRLVTPRALGPLHDIARETGGVLRERLAAGSAQEELFGAFLDELAAPPQASGTVVVVEDAHWADEATLDWLMFLGRRIERLSTLLVVTYRDDELGPDHPLRRVLAALPAAGSAVVPLPQLSRACVQEQGRRAGVDGDTVYQLAGGNPLLVTELLKGGAETVAGAVQNLILDRLSLLSDDARALAYLVSVVPTRAEGALISAAGDVAGVEECLAAGVLVPAGDGVAFRHELLRSTVEDSLSPPRRAALNRAVLDLLVGLPEVDPSRLVHHARLAGDDAAVLHYGRLAGADAARQGAYREAAQHLRAAVEVANGLEEPALAELLEQYGRAAYLAGHFEESLTPLRRALALREALGQPEHMGEDLRLMSRVLWWAGRREEARHAVSRAIAVLEAAPEGRELAMAYNGLAQLYLTAHQLDDASTWAQRAREVADRLGDRQTALDAAITTAVARAHDDPRTFLEMDRLHEEAAQAGYLESAARSVINPALMIGDELATYDEEAVERHERALRYLWDRNLDGYALHLIGSRARLRFERGEWDGAEADARTALVQPGLLGMNAVLPLVVLGRIHGARGSSGADEMLEEAGRHADGVEDLVMVAAVADARSESLLWSGEREGAQDAARRALARARTLGGTERIIGRLAYRVWRAGGEDESPPEAAEPYAAMIRGDWRRASAEWETRGATVLRAEALAAGDDAAAAEALRVLDGLGATRAANFVRSELRRRGSRRVPRGPRRSTADHPAGLTPRQVEVLGLLVEGLSNAEIAQRLSLSVKTVDHHISAVLGKLGVSSRGQAAAAALRLNLVD